MLNPPEEQTTRLLRPTNPVGIIGYGAYVPRYRLPAKEVSRIWMGGRGGLPIKEKAVPGLDEDVATMSIEAASNDMNRAPCRWDLKHTTTRLNRHPRSLPRRSAQFRVLRPQTGSSPAKQEQEL